MSGTTFWAYGRTYGAPAAPAASGRASRARASEFEASLLTIRSLKRRREPDLGRSSATSAASVTMSSTHDL